VTQRDKLFPSERSLLNWPSIPIPRARELNAQAPWKIAVWRPRGGIGDLLMLTPTFKELKYIFPNCSITLVTSPEYCDGVLVETVWGNPHINNIADYRIVDLEQFDIVLNMDCPCVPMELPGRIPPNRIDLFAWSAGLSLHDTQTVYVLKPEEIKWANDFLAASHVTERTPIIFYQPFASNRKRSVTVDQSKQILSALRIRWPSCAIFVSTHGTDWAGPVDFSLMNCIHLKNYSLRLLAALINVCHCTIAPDSAMLHVAGALKRPLIGLFGPTPPESRLNYYPNSVGICPGKGLKCYTSWYENCSFGYACWNRLSSNDVILATERALQGQYDSQIKEGHLNTQGIMIEEV